jgi:hypothetical protein
MVMERKLVALRQKLLDAQRGLILQAAESETVPASGALRQIAELESAIVATEAILEEERKGAE